MYICNHSINKCISLTVLYSITHSEYINEQYDTLNTRANKTKR